ncbi:MAG: HesA/MoeB/ThiF family protein [Peptococcaceae bacterium]|nr:HesA/MoeB/ThiF family protein [Peptococcaceae bacterium]
MEYFRERYVRNQTAISQAEQDRLAKAKVLVAGCGGLGGYIIELLGRIGVGHITAVDSDVFEASNLNRQILSSTSTLGLFKAEVAKTRMAEINPLVEMTAITKELNKDNALSLVQGHDLVVDALDNAPSRLILLSAARTANIPFVHGAIVGWRGRVSVAYPQDRALEKMLAAVDQNFKAPDGNLGFTAAYTASRQAAEAVKILLGRGTVCRSMLLEFDLLNGTYYEIPLQEAEQESGSAKSAE